MPMPNELPSHACPEEALLWFDGLDGRRGSYLLLPVPPQHLADLACEATAVDRARVREPQAWVARGEGKARRRTSMPVARKGMPVIGNPMPANSRPMPAAGS